MKKIRYNALIIFPGKSLNDETIKKIKEEGYTGIAVVVSQAKKPEFTGQGFSMEEFYELVRICDKYALPIQVFTGYQKYQEELLQSYPHRKMVCSGGSIDSDGLTTVNWLCPFQPENKADYVDFLMNIIKVKAVTEIHLNDEASIGFSGNSIGCYCDYCKNQFFLETGHYPPLSATKEDEELWGKWNSYRMRSWNEVHKYFKTVIKQKRPDIRVGIQYSPSIVANMVNPFVLGIDLPGDARNLDIISTDPYHKTHTALYSYKPCERFLTESTRMLKGATVDCEMNIYPQAFFPPLTSYELTEKDGLLAGTIPFALGANAVTPYSYELMKLIPGFSEAFGESMKMKRYFEKSEPYTYVSVVNPQYTHIKIYQEGNWGDKYLNRWPSIMNQVGFPWEWVFDSCIKDRASRWNTKVMVVPEACILPEGQLSAIQMLKRKGVGILWVGQSPFVEGKDWNENSRIIFEVKENKWGIIADYPKIVMDFATFKPAISGDVIAEHENKPVIIVKNNGIEREAWISGVPVYDYVKPGSHGSVRQFTGGISLFKNLLKWLAKDVPTACLEPWPPPNAYRTLRPWDIRDVPTMELFPMISENSIFCLIINYVALAYETNLVLKIPEGKVVKSFKDVMTGQDLISKCSIDGDRVSLPVYMDGTRVYMAVELIY